MFTSRETRTQRGIGGKQTFLILRIMLGSLENAKMSNCLSKGILKPNHRSQMGKYKLTLILLHFDLLCFTDIPFFTKWRQDLPPAKGRQLVLLRSSLSCSGLEPTPSILPVSNPEIERYPGVSGNQGAGKDSGHLVTTTSSSGQVLGIQNWKHQIISFFFSETSGGVYSLLRLQNPEGEEGPPNS